jgi:ABC-type uncharacterized transport system permease subunit
MGEERLTEPVCGEAETTIREGIATRTAAAARVMMKVCTLGIDSSLLGIGAVIVFTIVITFMIAFVVASFDASRIVCGVAVRISTTGDSG